MRSISAIKIYKDIINSNDYYIVIKYLTNFQGKDLVTYAKTKLTDFNRIPLILKGYIRPVKQTYEPFVSNPSFSLVHSFNSEQELREELPEYFI